MSYTFAAETAAAASLCDMYTDNYLCTLSSPLQTGDQFDATPTLRAVQGPNWTSCLQPWNQNYIPALDKMYLK